MKNMVILDDPNIASEPLTDKWTGSLDHIGPVETFTPLMELIAGKTTCGTVTLMSGVMLCGAQRLRPFTAVDYLLEIAEAIFAWQHDWRYVDFYAGVPGESPEEPAAISAAMTLRELFLLSISDSNDWHSFFQPITDASHMVNIVQFILPKTAKKQFQAWLRTISARLDTLADIPDMEAPQYSDFPDEKAFNAYSAPRRGPPLPPIALDLSVDISALDLAQEAAKFLASLDHTKNRYLRSPQDMIDMGFVGTPYGPAV